MKTRMVTRTIKTTTVSVLVADIENETTLTEDVTISQQYADEKKLFKTWATYATKSAMKTRNRIK